MAEAGGLETEEDGVVTMEKNCLSAREETHVREIRGAEKQGDESDPVTQPLLQHKHQDHGDENHKADTQTTADGAADRKTSVPQELESAVRDQAGCSHGSDGRSGGSSCHECPICSEPLDWHQDGRVTLLHCNHTLCHRCTAGIMSLAKEPGRLRCPLCRQTTPLPQWEIRRLQEESYFTSVHQLAPALVIPELQAASASPWCWRALERQLEAHTYRNICGCCVYPSCLLRGLRLMRLHCLCFALTALLLLFLVLLGCFLHVVLPGMMHSILFGNS